MQKRHLVLSAFVPSSGAGGSTWRLPDIDPTRLSSFATYRRVAEQLEAGCFDALFMNDGLGIHDVTPEAIEHNTGALHWDPLTLLPALAVVTERIGLIATGSTTYNEPYTLARRLASLDHLSAGRAGWNVVTSLGGGENYGRDDHMPHAERYRRAEEFADVIRGLWDSWEDDAAIMDKASGRWVDAAKMHLVNHRGASFRVRGPLNEPRMPQGYPVIAQAGSSDVGRELAARIGELIFTAVQTLEQSLAFGADITVRAARHGRTPADFRILPGVSVTVGETQSEAEAKFDRLQDLVDPVSRLKLISAHASLGVDLSDHPLDGPVSLPKVVPRTNVNQSRQALIFDLVRRENPTIRQLLRTLSAAGHRVLIGTPASIADDFALWLEAGAADGFNIMFPALQSGVEDFVRLVVPELQQRGLFRTAYTQTTLRGHIGLARPANQYAAEPSGPIL